MRARTQFTAAATAVAALLVALTGQFLVWRLDQRDRADLDRALVQRAGQIRAAATLSGTLPADGVYAVRLMSGTQVRVQSGSAVQFAAPVRDGYSTVAAADGREYRSWAETLKSGVQLQVLTALADVQARHTEAVRLVDGSVLVAILLGGLATWFAGGVLLRPLHRLRDGAGELRPDDLSGRLPGVAEPREVAEVAASVNALLDRMQAAAQGRPAPVPPAALPAALRLALPAVSTVTPPPERPDTFPPRPVPLALPAGPAPASAAADGAPGGPGDEGDRGASGAIVADRDAAAVGPADSGAPGQAPAEAGWAEVGWAEGARVDETLRDALAKLGDDLDTLLDNPELSSTQRHLLLASIQNEYRRIVLLTTAADTV